MTLREVRDRAAKRYLEKLMQRTHGDAAIAAKVAGCNRTTFYRVLKRHGLRPMMRAHRGRW